MKDPKFGSNRKQSFIDFETTYGKARFGLEDLILFAEFAGSRVNLTSTRGYLSLFDGIDITSAAITLSTPLGTTPVGTVSIKEYGNGRAMVTELTLTDFIVGALAGAAAALGVGNIVYAFPAGSHIEESCYQELSLKCAGTAVNADAGLGSVIATGAVAVLDGTGTFEDRLTGQTIPTAAGGGSLTKALVKPALTGISVNIGASVKNVFLNAAATWNANNSGNLTATGKIVIKWTKMS